MRNMAYQKKRKKMLEALQKKEKKIMIGAAEEFIIQRNLIRSIDAGRNIEVYLDEIDRLNSLLQQEYDLAELGRHLLSKTTSEYHTDIVGRIIDMIKNDDLVNLKKMFKKQC